VASPMKEVHCTSPAEEIAERHADRLVRVRTNESAEGKQGKGEKLITEYKVLLTSNLWSMTKASSEIGMTNSPMRLSR